MALLCWAVVFLASNVPARGEDPDFLFRRDSGVVEFCYTGLGVWQAFF